MLRENLALRMSSPMAPSCESVRAATLSEVEARPWSVADVSICFCICLRV